MTGSVVPRIRHSTLHSDARILRETLERIQSIRPDHTELACLKALVLFKPGNAAQSLYNIFHVMVFLKNIVIPLSSPLRNPNCS